MKFCYPEINYVFDTSIGCVNTIVVENPRLLYRLLTDMQDQINGSEGTCVVSDNNKVLTFARSVECISQFVPFDINQKSLVNKAVAVLEQQIISGEHYERAMNVLGSLESLLYDASLELTGDIVFTKLNMGAVIKAVGMEFANDYDSLGEKIIDYMELVNEFDNTKLFILVNMRSYMDDEETKLFMETVLQHQFHVIMIESREYNSLYCEKRYVIDKDLCEIPQ